VLDCRLCAQKQPYIPVGNIGRHGDKIIGGGMKEAPPAMQTGERPPRWGRPRREFAGEVEERIVDAAAKIFLDRGLEGATIDEIAEQARAGKPSIYARFPNKEAIFCAVVARKVRENMHWETVEAIGSTPEERLKAIAACLLQRVLTPEIIALMRSTIAEGRRFPELGSDVYRMLRERGNEAVALLLGEFAKCETQAPPSLAPDRLQEMARRFAELVISPLTMRALFGEDPSALRAEIGPHVEDSVAFFLAAVRSGNIP
jgi:AcrR family transcriptional regulator